MHHTFIITGARTLFYREMLEKGEKPLTNTNLYNILFLKYKGKRCHHYVIKTRFARLAHLAQVLGL